MKKGIQIRVTGIALLLIFFTGISFQPAPSKRSAATRPNIIVIVIDDAGYADFGFMGSKDLRTPHIDTLARLGIKFTDAHVSATVCSPSRAGILTGKYQQRFGYECNEGPGYTGMDTSQVLLPAILKEQGYATAAFGKWHLGFQAAQHPLRKGFDYYYGFLSGSRSYFYRPDKDDRLGSKNALYENERQVPFEGYLTDVLARQAARFIRQHRDQPFFIYWAPNAVHTPMEASEEDLALFEDHSRKMLAAMTFSLDRAVGILTHELKRQSLFNNTLIFFLSDNGGAHNNQSTNTPLKGFKGNKFEAGHRVPFLLSWPEQIAGNREFKGLSSSLDILPTALEAAGVKMPASFFTDGVSLLPFLKNKKKADPHTQLVWRKDKAAAIRVGSYKLIQVQGAGDRLYDLRHDLGETIDLCQTKPDLYQDLKARFRAWEKDKMQPAWTEGALWDTITLMIHDDLMQNRKLRVRNPEELSAYQKNHQPIQYP